MPLSAGEVRHNQGMIALAAAATAVPLTAMAWALPPVQAARGIPITRPVAFMAALAGTLTAVVVAALGIYPAIAVAAGALINLTVITFWTDLKAYKIPRETNWLTVAIGLAAAAWWLAFSPDPVNVTVMIPALVLSALLLVSAFITWWFGLTGYGDVLLLLALGATTAWWLSYDSLLPGLVGMLIALVIVAVTRRTPSAKALKAKVPAGPVYATLYVVAAAATVITTVTAGS